MKCFGQATVLNLPFQQCASASEAQLTVFGNSQKCVITYEFYDV